MAKTRFRSSGMAAEKEREKTPLRAPKGILPLRDHAANGAELRRSGGDSLIYGNHADWLAERESA